MKLPFTKPTFDTITSGLAKMAEQLTTLTETNDAQVAVRKAAIQEHAVTINTLEAETARAVNTAGKLRALIG